MKGWLTGNILHPFYFLNKKFPTVFHEMFEPLDFLYWLGLVWFHRKYLAYIAL